MNHNQIVYVNTRLAIRAAIVIKSCETEAQLMVARRYASLVHKELHKYPSAVNYTRFSDRANFYLGYVACKLGIKDDYDPKSFKHK